MKFGFSSAPCCRGVCWYGEETDECRWDQVYVERCLGAPGEQSSYPLTPQQQAFRFLPLPPAGVDLYDGAIEAWKRKVNVPILRRWADLSIESDGGNHTVNRGSTARDKRAAAFRHTDGSGYRAVYDLSNLESSVFMIATGQSHQPRESCQ